MGRHRRGRGDGRAAPPAAQRAGLSRQNAAGEREQFTQPRKSNSRNLGRAFSVNSVLLISAETILTLKNRELIHFGFLRRGFVGKESIHDTQIDSFINTRFIFTLYDTQGLKES